MHTGIAQPAPINTTAVAGMPLGASRLMTVKATMAPIITTSPCAKLMSWMMPYTMV